MGWRPMFSKTVFWRWPILSVLPSRKPAAQNSRGMPNFARLFWWPLGGATPLYYGIASRLAGKDSRRERFVVFSNATTQVPYSSAYQQEVSRRTGDACDPSRP